MTIQEFARKYDFHDSCITNIDYQNDDAILIMEIDFCNWSQEGYTPDEPELIKLRLVFSGIHSYDGPTGEVDYFSIGNSEYSDGQYLIFIEDDFHKEFWEVNLSPVDVEVEILGPVEE